jgi:hypothetical protein
VTALLITLPVSPYVELARWTLDRRGVAYTEEAHAPVFHVLATRRHGGTGTVPVLDLGSESLIDARHVVRRFDPLPDAEAEQLFDELFDVLGVAVRAWRTRTCCRTVRPRSGHGRASTCRRGSGSSSPQCFPSCGSRWGATSD